MVNDADNRVTPPGRNTQPTGPCDGVSLFPEMAEAALLRQRVLPAEFARALGVSRTSVSRWVQRGYVVLGVDGRCDPVAALRRLISVTDPSRHRARWLRMATADLAELRAEAAEAGRLRDELSTERRAAAENHGEMAAWLESFERRIAAIPIDLRASDDPAAWAARVHAELLTAADGFPDGACAAGRGAGLNEP